MNLAVVNLTSGGLSGGYRKYLQSLIPLLRDHPEIDELANYVPETMTSALQAASVGAMIPYAPREQYTGFRGLRDAIRATAPDAVFIPTQRWLDCGAIPSIVMVRNMEPLLHPLAGNRALEAGKNLGRAFSARRACRRADRVIAVSQFVGDFLRERWSIPGNKIGVVRHGVSAAARAQDPAKPDTPFLFTAGSIRPARGLEDVIGAMEVIQRAQLPHRLIVAGDIGDGNPYHRKMEALARRLAVEDRISWAGQLGPREMAGHYLGCSAFVMTSRVEACPNVALEAMCNGCVCVSSDAPPMPEFFGSSAYYYRRADAADLGRQLVAILTDTAAPRRADRESTLRTFSWEKTAEGTVREIQRAIA
jgi:glycosyltransferase involved in cell wall biosynthesis